MCAGLIATEPSGKSTSVTNTLPSGTALRTDAVAAVRSTVPPGSVFVTGANVPGGAVEISPARQPVAAS